MELVFQVLAIIIGFGALCFALSFYADKRCHYCNRISRWRTGSTQVCQKHHEWLSVNSTDNSWLNWEKI